MDPSSWVTKDITGHEALSIRPAYDIEGPTFGTSNSVGGGMSSVTMKQQAEQQNCGHNCAASSLTHLLSNKEKVMGKTQMNLISERESWEEVWKFNGPSWVFMGGLEGMDFYMMYIIFLFNLFLWIANYQFA